MADTVIKPDLASAVREINQNVIMEALESAKASTRQARNRYAFGSITYKVFSKEISDLIVAQNDLSKLFMLLD